jgi:hypothetical protein
MRFAVGAGDEEDEATMAAKMAANTGRKSEARIGPERLRGPGPTLVVVRVGH